MLMLMTTSMLIMMISLIMMLLASFLSKKKKIDREKFTPFECGFDPHSSSRMPFSMRFFLITIMFLIFDVEIALIMPIILIFKMSNMLTMTLSIILFILILLIGLYHEWNQGMLNWS
uniref:NADH-ubiquinone oxidoreductase chain 3 n=1 Tax=Paratrichobius longicrus TaxID=402416 RepID=A0A5B9RJL5_9MUSC|nr:NADH dehydrogenase subunit 3 [Paratrichobius longicrus]QEG77650.1 NADH dehydrogenase subunit 3 [Paratrichobius longicrus]